MDKFWKWTLASVIGFGTTGVVANLMTKEVKAVEIITHGIPHEVHGVPGEPDNNGKVSFQAPELIRIRWHGGLRHTRRFPKVLLGQ